MDNSKNNDMMNCVWMLSLFAVMAASSLFVCFAPIIYLRPLGLIAPFTYVWLTSFFVPSMKEPAWPYSERMMSGMLAGGLITIYLVFVGGAFLFHLPMP